MTSSAEPTDLTVAQLKRVLPKTVQNRVNEDLVNYVNDLMEDPVQRETFRENLLSYTSVMQDGRYKIGDYVNAVRYVSYKLLGASNIVAYTKTFPDRFQRLVDMGYDNKTISSYAVAYNKNKIVTEIFKQTMMPTHIINADIYQKAINTQATLMVTANSELVRTQAANSLLIQLKPPEAAKIELDITHKDNSGIKELNETMRKFAVEQRRAIEAKTISTLEVAHSKIIPGEVVINE